MSWLFSLSGQSIGASALASFLPVNICYAKVAKSPNDRQRADIRCKRKSFYYQARAGAPTDTDVAAIGRSPELWVTLLI